MVKEIFHHCDTHFSLCLEIKSEKLNIWFSHFNSVEFEEGQFTGYIQLTGPEVRYCLQIIMKRKSCLLK